MPQMGSTSIRNQSGTLNFSKGGSTSIYLDQNASTASDKNDGYSWGRPKKTFAGVTDILEPWMEIFARPGIYQENVVIDEENVIIHGLVQAGPDRVEIAPISGVPLDVQVGYVELEGLALVSSNSSVCKLTGPGHHLHDLYVEVNVDDGAQYSGVLLNDADKLHFHDNHLNGRYYLNTVGVRLDGTLNASVDCFIHDNYFEKFGTVATAGIGVDLNNAQRCLLTKNIFDSCYNGMVCEVHPNSLHTICGNQFYANASVDICDLNPIQQDSGIWINNNYFGYAGWNVSHNNSGIASVPVQCYYNYDMSPLAYPHYQGPSFVPRYVA